MKVLLLNGSPNARGNTRAALEACAAELLELIQDGCKKFALCHLSQTNNTPELALTTVYNVLLAAGIQPGRDVLIQAQARNDISPYIEF